MHSRQKCKFNFFLIIPEHFFDCSLQERHASHICCLRYSSALQDIQHLVPERGLHLRVARQLIQGPGHCAGDLKSPRAKKGLTTDNGIGAQTGQRRCSYCVNSCKKKLCDVAVDSLHGQPGLGQEVGEITALHLLSTGQLLCFSLHTLVDVTFCCRHR